MQLHWFWFNTIAIVHCDNNENWINTQIIASGLSLVITPTFGEYKWISAAATFVIYCRQLPQKNSTDLEEPGKPEMQLWFALARRLLLPTQTGDKECSISAICLFFSHLPPSLCFSWKTTTTDLFSFVSTGAAVVMSGAASLHFLSFFGLFECKAWSCGKWTVYKKHFHPGYVCATHVYPYTY